MNCVLYARVSTERQADKELSIPAQLDAMRAFAAQRNWSVAAEFVEPGASARTAQRPQLQRLMAGVQSGELRADVLLVHKVDRLARSVHDHATIRALLAKAGVRLASVAENVDDSVPGQLVENIMASIAEFYSANLSEETRKGMRQLVLRGGWPHRPPRGYVMVRDPGERRSRCEVHPREGKLIAEAFERYATGAFSVKSVSAWLARQGLTSRAGQAMSHSHMRRILTNTFYTGRILWSGGVEASGQHKPIVSAATFDRVRAVLGDRTRAARSSGSTGGFPLRRFAICSVCRGRFTVERHGRFRYYRCSRQAYRRSACDARYCRAELAHDGLQRLLKRHQISRDSADRIMRVTNRLLDKRSASSRKREGRVNAQLRILSDAEAMLADAFTSDTISPDVFRRKAAELRASRASLEHDALALRADPRVTADRVQAVLRLASCLWDVYEHLDDARRAEMLRAVFSSIVMSSEGILAAVMQPAFREVAAVGVGTGGKGIDRAAHAALEAAEDQGFLLDTTAQGAGLTG